MKEKLNSVNAFSHPWEAVNQSSWEHPWPEQWPMPAPIGKRAPSEALSLIRDDSETPQTLEQNSDADVYTPISRQL